MSKSKEKRIKKLKTKHIWPSVVVLLITLLMLLFIVGVIISVNVLNSMESDYLARYNSAKAYVKAIERDVDNGASLQQAVINREDAHIVILDKSGNLVAGENFTGNYKQKIYMGIEEEYGCYVDTENLEKSWIDAEGTSIRSLSDVFVDTLYSGTKKDKINAPVYETHVWMIMQSKLDGYTILVKADVGVTFREMIYTIVLCAIVAVAMLIPILIMLGNVISSVRMQKKLRMLTRLDEVTGGKNWIYFKEEGHKLAEKRRNKAKTYVIADMELMKYRGYCAYMGVAEGEKLLERIDGYVTSHIKKDEICARYARSSFVLMLECVGEENARQKLEALVGGMNGIAGRHRTIFRVGYTMLEPTVDASGRVVRRRNVDVAGLFNNASAARSAAVASEENVLNGFTDKILENQLWEHQVEELMEDAIRNREFLVYYQPKYNPVTNELAGAEALIRWMRPDGLVPPGRFIPIFEKNGFITKIDDYMLDNVARQQAEWYKQGKKIVPVSVNVSRAHFAEEQLAEHIAEIVDQYDIDHKYIEIELTESAFFDDKNVLLNTVKKLKDAGFEISMDDFGAGYSSLNSLKDLPLDVLKLDAEFFRGDDMDERAEIVVKEAISLAKNLDMRIVAEGIEKKEQVDFLAGVGCDMIQGYYFAKPMPAGDYEERM